VGRRFAPVSTIFPTKLSTGFVDKGGLPIAGKQLGALPMQRLKLPPQATEK
jgi:hypothetical protein